MTSTSTFPKKTEEVIFLQWPNPKALIVYVIAFLQKLVLGLMLSGLEHPLAGELIHSIAAIVVSLIWNCHQWRLLLLSFPVGLGCSACLGITEERHDPTGKTVFLLRDLTWLRCKAFLYLQTPVKHIPQTG